ncbi:PrpF domain-containing protein [Cohnella kolymensis]|uniref:PrpF domain-containing protein n=1 Tax=Cohnella kolymensis TaxID=1590652 RepID=UPI00190F945B|nr:PrpF domain-containing protein [Cohnella kolymensis]
MLFRSVPYLVRSIAGAPAGEFFFHKKDLPEDIHERNIVFFEGIDASNPSQINGLGSGTSHTSKVVVISPPSAAGADVDYTFYQIGIGEKVADDKGTCGNLMAAVGAFAVDEGLVEVDSVNQFAQVTAFNTNIGKMIKLQVPVTGGKARVAGDYLMPGLVTTGAKYTVDILTPGGGKTGATLPLGSRLSMTADSDTIELSFVDVVNPFVYVSAASLGLTGTEPNSVLSENKLLLDQLESMRREMAVRSGMEATLETARLAPAVPKVAIVAEPQDYITSSGQTIRRDEVDIVAKMVSMGRFHRTFAGSGLYNLAAAVLLPGTIPNQLTSIEPGCRERIVRIGHPDGVAEVRAALVDEGNDVAFVGLERTARRIMKGDLYVPD